MIGGYYQAILHQRLHYNAGQCARLSGTSYVDLSANNAQSRYQYQKSLTITCWVNVPALNTATHTALLGTSIWASSTFGFNLGVRQNTNNIMFYYFHGSPAGSQVQLLNAGTLAFGSWRFFAMQLDADQQRARLYTGSVGSALTLLQDLPATPPTTIPGSSATYMNIGYWSSRYADGVKFFDYRQYSERALSLQELQSIHTFGTVRQGLTVHHKLDTLSGAGEPEVYGKPAAAWVNFPGDTVHYYGTDVPSYSF